MKRRAFLKAALALPAGRALAQAKATPRVVVVGAGYGGATAAKYLRMWSGGSVDVTLVDSDTAFVSCPLSNLVIGGSKTLADITVGYEGLARRGVKMRVATAQAVDPEQRVVRLAAGDELPYDRLVLSPGVAMLYDEVDGMGARGARESIMHAWKAGPQTLTLRRQLEAMRDGGVFVISIPRAPYRCPPGPYERACQAAWYFRRAKPRSKVLVLDGNEEIVSKKALFTRAFNEDYKGIVEYRPNYVLTGVDAATLTAKFETEDDVRADVLNVVPPQRAGDIARQAGVITANGKWCEVDFLSFESIKVPRVHVLGDAIQIAPLMPKSGHMANQQAKVAAAAIINALAGEPPDPEPVMSNACYSFITDKDSVHVASVHRYDKGQKTFLTVPGSGGLSAQPSAVEGEYGLAWARNIWSDMLA